MKIESWVEKMIQSELLAARAKHPDWPEDIVHGAAIVAEESGELVRASLRVQYEGADESETMLEAIQTIVTCIRFLEGK